MDDRAQWELEMRRVFLSETDAACPRCNFNLRGTPGDKCPECSLPIQLAIAPILRGSRWEHIATIAVTVSALYFLIMTIVQASSALSSAYSGVTLSGLRTYFILNAGTNLLMALLAGGWVVVIFTHQRRPHRPEWTRPTSAAAGVLLGTFIVYLALNSARALFL